MAAGASAVKTPVARLARRDGAQASDGFLVRLRQHRRPRERPWLRLASDRATSASGVVTACFGLQPVGELGGGAATARRQVAGNGRIIGSGSVRSAVHSASPITPVDSSSGSASRSAASPAATAAASAITSVDWSSSSAFRSAAFPPSGPVRAPRPRPKPARYSLYDDVRVGTAEAESGDTDGGRAAVARKFGRRGDDLADAPCSNGCTGSGPRS